MKLNKDEQKVFDLLKEGKYVSLDEIVEALPNTSSRKGWLSRMEHLTAKLAPLGWIVEKRYQAGRGYKNSYIMKRRFNP